MNTAVIDLENLLETKQMLEKAAESIKNIKTKDVPDQNVCKFQILYHFRHCNKPFPDSIKL